jgi:hypothetical protein
VRGQFSPALPPVGQTPPTTATVRGTILDAITRAPLPGATLSLGSGGSSTTDAAGLATLSAVPAGTYTGTVTAGGYLNQLFTAVLSGGSALDLGTVLLTSLTAPGSLTGLVVDSATNQPLAGVRLAVTGNTAVAAIQAPASLRTSPKARRCRAGPAFGGRHDRTSLSRTSPPAVKMKHGGPPDRIQSDLGNRGDVPHRASRTGLARSSPGSEGTFKLGGDRLNLT